jgi:hypothetical protein
MENIVKTFDATSFLILLGIIITSFFAYIWLREQRQKESSSERRQYEESKERERRQYEEREELWRQQRKYDEREELWRQQRKYETEQQELNDLLRNKFNEEVATEIVGMNSGGYIIIDVPETQKSMINDLLKGFEEFAKLKGYEIAFSSDNSIKNRFAFKFTITEVGVTVTTQQVRSDINGYINRVKNNDDFENLPILSTIEEHCLVVTALKNRLSMLRFNNTAQRNVIEMYEKILNTIGNTKLGVFQQPTQTFLIGSNPMNNLKNYSANNSSNFIQGEDNFYKDQSQHHIATNSFNDSKEVSKKIAFLMELLRNENIDEKDKHSLTSNLDKINEELTEQEQPDKQRISKWYNGLIKIVERVVLTHEASQAFAWLSQILQNNGYI